MRPQPKMLLTAMLCLSGWLATAPVAADDSVPANVRAELERRSHDDAFSGVVLLARDGKV